MKSATTLFAAALAAAFGLALCGCTAGEPQSGEPASSARAGESRANAARNADLTFSEPKFKSSAETTEVGDSTTAEVEVGNDSDTDVVVGEMNFLAAGGSGDSGVDPASAFSVVGDSCQGVIPAGGSCTITVGFTPTEVGTASAVLQVYIPEDNTVLDIPVTRTAMVAATDESTPTWTGTTDSPTAEPSETSEPVD